MNKRVFIIEYAKGSDKGFDGFRPDSKPILNAIEEVAGLKTEIVFYRPNKKYELLDYLKENAHAVISRINPGNLKGVDEYFQFLKALGNTGVEIHTHPDVMINLDFKDILAKSGILTTIRKTRGSDVAGACGQLAGKVKNKRKTLAK